jgi:hypothetical protein
MAAAHRSVDDFVAAWRRGERPRLEYFRPVFESNTDLLRKLVGADLACRLEAGETPRLENYLEPFPELFNEPAAAIGLIELEYVLRRRSEPALSWTDYADRFARFRNELRARHPPECDQVTAGEPFTKPPLGKTAGWEVGGGVYNLGTFATDLATVIAHNDASTSNDDIFP